MMLENLKSYNIILASKSPRRQELLKGIGVPFSIITKDVDESFSANISPYDVAPYLSVKKAKAFEENELPENYMVITADTVVVVDDEILGKPKDAEEARQMLRLISGKRHSVITGVSIRTKDKIKTFSAMSKVSFDTLGEEEIDYYVNNYKPFDKAGSYGVQEWIGYIGVNCVEGSYFNVMGLPTQKLYQMLKLF
jgi:septum formation protein